MICQPTFRPTSHGCRWRRLAEGLGRVAGRGGTCCGCDVRCAVIHAAGSLLLSRCAEIGRGIMPPSLPVMIGRFVKALFGHWVSLMTGGSIALALVLYERIAGAE